MCKIKDFERGRLSWIFREGPVFKGHSEREGEGNWATERVVGMMQSGKDVAGDC